MLPIEGSFDRIPKPESENNRVVTAHDKAEHFEEGDTLIIVDGDMTHDNVKPYEIQIIRGRYSDAYPKNKHKKVGTKSLFGCVTFMKDKQFVHAI